MNEVAICLPDVSQNDAATTREMARRSHCYDVTVSVSNPHLPPSQRRAAERLFGVIYTKSLLEISIRQRLKTYTIE